MIINGIKLYEYIKNSKNVKNLITLDTKSYLEKIDNRNEYCGYKIDIYS
jgi:hypothetical protein